LVGLAGLPLGDGEAVVEGPGGVLLLDHRRDALDAAVEVHGALLKRGEVLVVLEVGVLIGGERQGGVAGLVALATQVVKLLLKSQGAAVLRGVGRKEGGMLCVTTYAVRRGWRSKAGPLWSRRSWAGSRAEGAQALDGLGAALSSGLGGRLALLL